MQSFLKGIQNNRLLIVILLLAAVIRCWGLQANPPGFFRDEADKAVTAWSLLTTGRDLDGRLLPYFVLSLKIYTAGIYQYILIPFIFVLGLSEWVIRLPAALAGVATVWLAYLIGRRSYGRNTGLTAAAILAISPWHVHFSRWANQGIFLPLCVCLGVYAFLQGCGREQESGEVIAPAQGYRFRPFFIAALFFSLALYTYEPVKVFLPLFIIALVVIYWRDLFAVIPGQRLPYFYKFAALILLLSIPMSWYTFVQTDRSALRFDRVSILSQGLGLRDLIYLFIHNYLLHFSPRFLLFEGDANLRHSVAHVGQLLKPEGVALVLGLYAALRRRRREDLLLVGWFFLGSVPAGLTHEGIPHALRSIAILPSVQMLAAVGCVHLVEYFQIKERDGFITSSLPRRVIVITLVAAFVIFGGVYLVALFAYYPEVAAPWWEYGWREAIQYLEAHRGDYEEVVVSGFTQYPEIQVLYHARVSPAEYLQQRMIPGYRFLPFMHSCESDYHASNRNSLYLLAQWDHYRGEVLYQVNYPDGSIAWRIISNPYAKKTE